MKQTVLLVEDNTEIQQLVTQLLSQDYTVLTALSLREARQLLQTRSFDLVLLDLSLPDGDGFSLTHDPLLAQVEFIILTAKEDVPTKVAAFSVGAQDYITKPFHPAEFKARIQAKLSARQKQKEHQSALKFGQLILDPLRQEVWIQSAKKSSEKVDLTSKEFRILHVLLKNRGRVYQREQLLNSAWGANIAVTDRTVDQHISHLRKKIKGSAIKIQTVLGEGYKLTLSDGEPEANA